MTVNLRHGNCLDILPTLPDCSVDSIVTDPPYGLEFMGKDWDAPWKGKASREFNEIEKGSLGGFTKLPNHSRVNNVKCKNCDHWKFSSSPCKCDKPNFPNARLEAMNQFQIWCEQWAAECLRVLKPGGHLLAFGGTRTYHRMACAIEDAGFEIRDSIHWLYGSGFPKSLNVSKAIDKVNGEPNRLFKFTAWMRTTGLTARQLDEITETKMGNHYTTHPTQPAIPTAAMWEVIRPHVGEVPDWVDELVARIEAEREIIGKHQAPAKSIYTQSAVGLSPDVDITAPATESAKTWSGWGTALKPAHEPVVVARKPLIGTVAANVLEYGTGAINIDATRIAGDMSGGVWGSSNKTVNTDRKFNSSPDMGEYRSEQNPAGRWPANVILAHTDICNDDCVPGCPVALLDEQSGHLSSGANPKRRGTDGKRTAFGEFAGQDDANPQRGKDSGGASRFFYCAKPSRRERNAGLNHLEEQPSSSSVGLAKVTAKNWGDPEQPVYELTTAHTNHHPTVKPLALMRYLVRLVTPPGGTVLEPFAGSGTTLMACILEGFHAIGIEMTDEYLPIIKGRIAWAEQQASKESPQQELEL